MTVHQTTLPGVLLIEPRVFADDRGAFMERYHAGRYAEAGVDAAFVQDNWSRSRGGVVRGLHFQREHPQGKLVEVVRGEIWDVVVDLRPASETFGQWEAHTLSGDAVRQLWVPPGFAHGFAVVSDEADVLYKCTDVYRPGDEGGVAWDDPALAIPWPVEDPLLSDKDRAFPALTDLEPEDLPQVAVAL